jgi:hypothetical protein
VRIMETWLETWLTWEELREQYRAHEERRLAYSLYWLGYDYPEDAYWLNTRWPEGAEL